MKRFVFLSFGVIFAAAALTLGLLWVQQEAPRLEDQEEEVREWEEREVDCVRDPTCDLARFQWEKDRAISQMKSPNFTSLFFIGGLICCVPATLFFLVATSDEFSVGDKL